MGNNLTEFLKTIAMIAVPILTGITSYLYINVIGLKMQVAVLETHISDHKENISDVKNDIKEINSKLEIIMEIKADLKHLDNNVKTILDHYQSNKN